MANRHNMQIEINYLKILHHDLSLIWLISFYIVFCFVLLFILFYLGGGIMSPLVLLHFSTLRALFSF